MTRVLPATVGWQNRSSQSNRPQRSAAHISLALSIPWPPKKPSNQRSTVPEIGRHGARANKPISPVSLV